MEQRRIAEIDINPLLASPERLSRSTRAWCSTTPTSADADLPRLAIRPYPRQYVARVDGARRHDAADPARSGPRTSRCSWRFHAELTEETVYSRYFEHLGLSPRTAHERLTRVCFNDYDREIALVAEETTARREPRHRGRRPALQGPRGAGGRVRAPRRRPLAAPRPGAELLRELVQIGRDEGLAQIRADILAGNNAMRRTAMSAGFPIEEELGDQTVRAVLDLADGLRAASASAECSVLVARARDVRRPARVSRTTADSRARLCGAPAPVSVECAPSAHPVAVQLVHRRPASAVQLRPVVLQDHRLPRDRPRARCWCDAVSEQRLGSSPTTTSASGAGTRSGFASANRCHA